MRKTLLAVAMTAMLFGCSKENPEAVKSMADATAIMGRLAGISQGEACHMESRAVSHIVRAQSQPDGGEKIARAIASSADAAALVAKAATYGSDPEKAAEDHFSACIAAAKARAD